MWQCRLCRTELPYSAESRYVCSPCHTKNIGLKILQYYAAAAQRAESEHKKLILTREQADYLNHLCELDHNNKTTYATIVQSWLKKVRPFLAR